MVDDAYAMDSFGGVFNGFLQTIWHPNGPPYYKPEVLWTERPPLPFEPDRLYVLDELSDPSNYAHLLVDTLLPTIGVAQVYGEDPANVQLVETVNCHTWHKPDMLIPGLNKPASEVCEKNLRVWPPALLAHPMLLPPYGRDMCFRRLVMGQAGSMSLAGEFARGAITRAARTRLYEGLGLDPAARPSAHHILVLVKKKFIKDVEVPDICGTVRGWAAWWPEVTVTCIVPAEVTLREQIEALSKATVVVSEHGSTSYSCMFQVPGTSLLLLAPVKTGVLKWAKEPQVMLYFADLFVLYLDESRWVDKVAVPLLQSALDRAGKSLGQRFPCPV